MQGGDEQSVVVGGPPGTRVDGSRLRAIALYKLYRREEADGGAPKSAMLSSGRVVGYDEIAVIRPDSPAPASVQGSSVTWVDRRALSVGRRYVYVVTAEDTLGRSSGPSERLVVPYLAAPKAPRALRASPGDRRISLTWQPPAEMMDGSPAPGDLRYLVLRGAGAEGALAPITPQPLAGTSFTDTGVENDTDYRYAVRAVRVDPAVSASGETSAAVVARQRLHAPAAPPAGRVRRRHGAAGWNPAPRGRGILRWTGGQPGDSCHRDHWRSPPYLDRGAPGTTYATQYPLTTRGPTRAQIHWLSVGSLRHHQSYNEHVRIEPPLT